VFGRYDRVVGDFVVYLIDPNGMGESQLLPGGNECPRWSPNGKDISLGSGIFENAGQPNGIFRAFTTFAGTRYLPDPTLNLGCPVWSPDGRRLAYEGWDDTDLTRNGIYTLSAADGSDLQRLTSSPDGAHDLPGDYLADGSRLFFAHVAPNREQGPLMVVGMDGSEARMVTSDAYGTPSLSPDGQTLLAGRSGSLYLITVDGSLATAIEILNTTSDPGGASWSPDGSWIVFSLFRNDLGDIARVRPDGTGLSLITHDPANEEFADWAP
jgi:Tol biopolymer transport system component